jgi:hypothetical protein
MLPKATNAILIMFIASTFAPIAVFAPARIELKRDERPHPPSWRIMVNAALTKGWWATGEMAVRFGPFGLAVAQNKC